MLKSSVEGEAADDFEIIKDNEKAGKLYEAFALALVCDSLRHEEGLRLVISAGEKVYLKRGTGPINRMYPYIEVYRGDALVAEIWTDVCFLAQSYLMAGGRGPGSRTPKYGDFHELDIVMVDAGTNGYPLPEQIWLGAECKNTGMQKGILKEVLGVRRELSLLHERSETKFRHWPQATARSNPPCCLLLYSSDEAVENYARAGSFYDIQFVHRPLEADVETVA